MRGTKAKVIRKLTGGDKSRCRAIKREYYKSYLMKALINGAIEVYRSRA